MRHPFTLLGLLAAGALHAQFAVPEPIPGLDGTSTLRTADVDGDGDLDLVACLAGGVQWLPNLDGLGAFGPGQELIPQLWLAARFELADLTGDGAPEAVFIAEADNTLRWALNDGSGGFTVEDALLDLGVEADLTLGAIALANFNGDGWRDIVIATHDPEDGARLQLALNEDGEHFEDFEAIGPIIDGLAPTMLRHGDLDLSGGNDLIFLDGNLQLTVLRNVAGDASAWEPFMAYQSSFNDVYTAPQLIDVDGDGDLDLAEADFPNVHWLENVLGEGGELAMWVEHQLAAWNTAGPGAFGQLGCGVGAGCAFFPLNPSEQARYTAWVSGVSGFAYAQGLPDAPQATMALLADIDGDGKDDLITMADGEWRLMRNTLQPAIQEAQLPTLPALCKWGVEVPLPEPQPAGGQWSGPGVFNNHLLRSELFGQGLFTLGYTAYAAEGCPVGGTTPVLVVEQPVVTPNISGEQFCASQGPVQLASEPPATSWIGASPAGVFNPATFPGGGMGGGYIVAVFEDGTGETCAAEVGPIYVQQAVPASIAPAGPFCVNSGPQLITAAAAPPFGVSWEGDIAGWNSSGASFLPSQGPGLYQIILLAEATGPTTCANSDTLWVQVNDQFPQIAIEEVPILCADGDPIALEGLANPPGGTWAGPGVSGGQFLPALSGTGAFLITYTATLEGCSATLATAVKVLDATEVGTPDGLIFCLYDSPSQLTAFPEGGTWSAPVGADGVLSPADLTPGTYPVVYTWQGPNGCTLQNDPLAVEVRPTTVPLIDPLGPLCSTSAPIPVTGSPEGSWGGAVSFLGSTPVIDPAALGVGEWPITLTAAAEGECPGTASASVTIEICSQAEALAAQPARAWPNPFGDELWLETGTERATAIDVVDATGRLVLSHGALAAGSRVRLALAGAPAGVYLVRLAIEGAEPRVLRLAKH